MSCRYPFFRIGPEDRIIPDIELPDNCRDLIRSFYAANRQRTVEYHRQELEKIVGYDLLLKWDEQLGLTNISVGVHGGLDLDAETIPWHFQEHNLSGLNSLIAAAIATKYVSELLKSER